MNEPFIAAAVQMTSGADKAANLATATRLVRAAAAEGAKLVVLPELFNCLAPSELMHQHAEPVPGPTSQAMSQLAAELAILLVAGSFAEQAPGQSKAYNTSLLFSPRGELLARYRKLHLFNIDLPGQVTARESSWLAPGDEVVVTPTVCGRLGQAICYDLRFAALFERLSQAGAEMFCLPAAFTLATGRDHWELLVRARAVENQVYVVAANQYGRHTEKMVSYGRSMIVDPWGVPLAIAPDGECYVTATIDPRRQQEIRRHLPALEHRRKLPEASSEVNSQ